jgi:hypothetical protein
LPFAGLQEHDIERGVYVHDDRNRRLSLSADQLANAAGRACESNGASLMAFPLLCRAGNLVADRLEVGPFEMQQLVRLLQRARHKWLLDAVLVL